MGLKVAVQMDPIQSINIAGDSTFAMMLEAQRRGHHLFYYQTKALALGGPQRTGTRAIEQGTQVLLDGRLLFLVAPDDWDRDVADAIAAGEGLTLTQDHWDVIDYLREAYFNRNGEQPNNLPYVGATDPDECARIALAFLARHSDG